MGTAYGWKGKGSKWRSANWRRWLQTKTHQRVIPNPPIGDGQLWVLGFPKSWVGGFASAPPPPPVAQQNPGPERSASDREIIIVVIRTKMHSPPP